MYMYVCVCVYRILSTMIDSSIFCGTLQMLCTVCIERTVAAPMQSVQITITPAGEHYFHV